ncbi:hypothetical protein DYI24_00370 [Rhodopseudomonas sp. BR0C11]|uniref:hypothetical protein n=1 Tax=Rhodopseudomonas sp. BR0C11 TaxID=2269370 RepID=UPI0013DFF34F|nr:hypothetical protein [Rhodopseudomonas sp. BR0C11]NEV75535.1 hypothetical protein [Rhodopseudomonas sp. BR0C11]
MAFLDQVIWWLGVAALVAISFAAVIAISFFLLWLMLKFIPRWHVGVPHNDGELCFYDRSRIISGKGGVRIEGDRRMVNAPLRIKWWFGCSYRHSPKWFFGLIRWEPRQ